MAETNTIAVSACANFGNNNGQLVCDAPANAEGLPAGTYQSSCGGCQLDGETLSCSHCRAPSEPLYRESAIQVGGCSVIGNDHGKLVCEDAPAQADGNDDGGSGSGVGAKEEL